eukprot:1160247-Pelagomonas_calceolata.AAC.15
MKKKLEYPRSLSRPQITTKSQQLHSDFPLPKFCHEGPKSPIQFGGLAGQMWAAGHQKVGFMPWLIRQGTPNPEQ